MFYQPHLPLWITGVEAQCWILTTASYASIICWKSTMWGVTGNITGAFWVCYGVDMRIYPWMCTDVILLYEMRSVLSRTALSVFWPTLTLQVWLFIRFYLSLYVECRASLVGGLSSSLPCQFWCLGVWWVHSIPGCLCTVCSDWWVFFGGSGNALFQIWLY